MKIPKFDRPKSSSETEPYYGIIYNTGTLLDIPSGQYVRGQKGESILNGGIYHFGAVSGKQNSFKTTLATYLVLAAASRVHESGIVAPIDFHDTEMTVVAQRIAKLARAHPFFKDKNIYLDDMIRITSQWALPGEKWLDELKALVDAKTKTRDKLTIESPMVDDKGDPLSTLLPSFGILDSASCFKTTEGMEAEDLELGNSKQNTMHARQGLHKSNMIEQLPRICKSGQHHMLTTLHIGVKQAMMSANPNIPPPKDLQFQKSGEKYRSVPPNFTYLCSGLFEITKAQTDIDQGTKGATYPRLQMDKEIGETDLNKLNICVVRNKASSSGPKVEMMVSQREGVLPRLSEANHVFERRRQLGESLGINGSSRYTLDLHPEVNFMRTTLREHLDNDAMFARAMKVTSELIQIETFFRHELPKLPSPAELYEVLEKTYGMKKLLASRDYWTFNQYEHPIPFLSTMDLLRIYWGETELGPKYIPYWLA